MDFQYYSPSDESRSCVVRTLTKLTGKEYSRVKAELTGLAQEMGYETYNNEAVFERYLADLGMHRLTEFADSVLGDIKLESGTYCVYCTNRNGFYHLLPVVDNVIYDRRDDSRGLYVIAVYKKYA